ncbi:hypothetical protein BDQ12DRAFT_740169 [Crucibulum laeve]|uniref:Actin-like ATPase domain-containing protein n=1 Tax=Crucibulum laeve TaxID=68775 RepID=A0A5C3LEJ0_9AGAR|nr:hypothetical protein BDQ12DRAFT_740169 [Crucibulum laeve]
MSHRQAYTSSSRKLVLAFDVGTTYSGISYSILDPGQIPEIRGVTRFPLQEKSGGDSKIPTIIYYDQAGIVRAVGAEALKEGIEDEAEDQLWNKAEWFKLHLRPETESTRHIHEKIPPLPPNKSVVDVFGDFLGYLFQCAKVYIEETHAGGVDLWASVKNSIEFVLTHPNGWEGAQQSKMRDAAIFAGLVPNTREGRARVTFVTEGEASLYFCIQSGLTNDAIRDGEGVLIVDAGGGTIDISAYRRAIPDKGDIFEEIAPPQCHFHGSIFVTHHARVFLEELLQGSRFFDDVPHITKCFDKTTKLSFRNSDEPQYIKFGTARDRDPNLGIRSGQLKLSGLDVSTFFEPSIECIMKGIVEQCAIAHGEITSVFLVGGFAASNWLFARLNESLQSLGMNFCRPDSHVNKAVADGAISFRLDHSVRVRVSKLTYGIQINIPYDPGNPEHVRRHSTSYVEYSGQRRIRGAFGTILSKNTQVSETKEFRKPYSREAGSADEFSSLDVKIKCYRGAQDTPEWMDINSELYTTVCRVQAGNLQHLARKCEAFGTVYYKVNYDVVLFLGFTELTAHIAWEENGIERMSPATIVYDA